MVSDHALTAQYPTNSAAAPLIPAWNLDDEQGKSCTAIARLSKRVEVESFLPQRAVRLPNRIRCAAALVAGPSDHVDNHAMSARLAVDEGGTLSRAGAHAAGGVTNPPRHGEITSWTAYRQCLPAAPPRVVSTGSLRHRS